MSSVPAGWYKDPADTSTQRYWDGDGWVGKAIPADAVPPDGPPPPEEPEPAVEETPAVPETAAPPAYPQPGRPVGPPGPPPGWAPQPPPPPGWQPPPGMQPPPGWQPQPGAQPMKGHAYPYPVPEVRPHGLALAGLGQRLVARIIDIVVVLLLNVLVNGYFVYLYLQDFTPIFREYYAQVMDNVPNPVIQEATPRMSQLTITIVMVATLLWLAYEAPSTSSRGQTLGKRLMRIQVVGVDKPGRIGFARAFTRWARLGMWTLFWYCGIGLVIQFLFALSPLFDPRLRQAWHDKAAGTVVVSLPPGASPLAATTPEAAPGADRTGGDR